MDPEGCVVRRCRRMATMGAEYSFGRVNDIGRHHVGLPDALRDRFILPSRQRPYPRFDVTIPPYVCDRHLLPNERQRP